MHIHPSISSVFLRLPSSSRDINHISAIARRRLARRRLAFILPPTTARAHPASRIRRSPRVSSSHTPPIVDARVVIASIHQTSFERARDTEGSESPLSDQNHTVCPHDAPRHGSIQVGGHVRARGPVGARARARLRARASALGRGGRHRAGEGACGGKHLAWTRSRRRVTRDRGGSRSRWGRFDHRSIDRGVPNVRRVVGCVVVK